MHRRTLLQRLISVAGVLGLMRSKALPQGVFTPQQLNTLIGVASFVLPSALDNSGRTQIAKQFERYVSDYHPGADTEHGYGFTHVVPKPLSPLAEYRTQLASLPSPVTREAVEHALGASLVKELPRTPAGKNVIADLMSFYFRSSEANDLCYSASIGRDQCRGLSGSNHPPAPLRSASI